MLYRDICPVEWPRGYMGVVAQLSRNARGPYHVAVRPTQQLILNVGGGSRGCES